MCIDSTSVIWGIRGNAPPTTQWAFHKCHKAMKQLDIRIKWSPGHMEIEGNEEADRLANAGVTGPHGPGNRQAANNQRGSNDRPPEAPIRRD
ncbi:hypothetical protein DID88_009552 [Monilinia fructigena]|uniref:RNase H type-1 domain-containing protein n=1 Tax=Monilinia fructigena TaxID=38457 RepID=A0A395IQ40_9HELO|nr:hypothetical protein DID88_009552 [Monilinia fructigena]